MEEHYFKSKIGKIHYYHKKGKYPAIFIHGIGGNGKSWLKISRFLSDEFDAYFIDLPGHGKSDKPFIQYTLDLNANILKDFIDLLGTKDIILAGNSYGGWLVLYFSIKIISPKLIILEDSAGLNSPIGYSNKNALNSFIESLLRIGNEKFVIENMIKNNMEEKYRIKEDELKNIKSRTIIIWGKEDKIIPIEFAYKFKKYIEHSELYIIEGAGHIPHFEKPEDFSSILNNEILNIMRNV